MLVKMSYFPRWHVSGATGPYRVSPNEMVVIPTSKDVSLTYDSGAGLGGLITSATVLVGLLTAFIRYRWRSKTSK